MNNHHLLRNAMIWLPLFLLPACTDKTDDLQKQELSQFAINYLGMKFGAQEAMKSGQAGAINRSFMNLYSNYRQFSAGRTLEDSTGVDPADSTKTEPGDSTIYGTPWVSCAVITETRNDDGSITTVTDYGTGCDEGWDDWKYRMWGKITSTYLYSNIFSGSLMTDTYSYSTDYDHYGGFYYADSSNWEMDGYSIYAGESKYDTADYSFSGWYTYQDDNSYRWNDEQYIYKGEGKTTYTTSSWVTEYADYEYSNGSDYYYKSSVLEPLVMDYTCTSPLMYFSGVKSESSTDNAIYVMTYVSGVEDIVYRQDGAEGHFTIDYGDGACDNIVTITENGETVVIDLAEYWMNANPDGTVSADGTVSSK